MPEFKGPKMNERSFREERAEHDRRAEERQAYILTTLQPIVDAEVAKKSDFNINRQFIEMLVRRVPPVLPGIKSYNVVIHSCGGSLDSLREKLGRPRVEKGEVSTEGVEEKKSKAELKEQSAKSAGELVTTLRRIMDDEQYIDIDSISLDRIIKKYPHEFGNITTAALLDRFSGINDLKSRLGLSKFKKRAKVITKGFL